MSKINFHLPWLDDVSCDEDGRVRISFTARRKDDWQSEEHDVTLHIPQWQLTRLLKLAAVAIDRRIKVAQKDQAKFQKAATETFKEDY